MIGLEVTRRTMPSPVWLATLRESGTPQGRAIAGLWADPSAFMNAACVIAYLLNPGLFRTERRREAVEIHDETQIGRTRVVQDGEADIQVATDVDVEDLFPPLYERLASPAVA